MPRDGSGIYTQPFPDVVSGTPIESTVYNGFVADVAQDMNAVRPIIAGGTGGDSATEARFNMGAETSAQVVSSYDTHLWEPGSFYSAAAVSDSPVPGHAFAGICYIKEALASPPTNQNVVVEARDLDDANTPGVVWIRQKTAGVWSSWATEFSGLATSFDAKVDVAGDTMTGPLVLSGAPTIDLHAATKKYVDDADAAKANLASPTFTGTPAAPTASAGTNTTQIATTAFVQAAVTAAFSLPLPPTGRLSLVSGTQIMTTSQLNKTTIYFVPYKGGIIWLYDGTIFRPHFFGTELSCTTTDTTKNPSAIGATKVNDWFVWNDGGTLRLSHGPDWTDDTTRSAGTVLSNAGGILVNAVAITNACDALRGVYVGTTRSSPTSQLNWQIGAVDTGALLFVWNMYNRVKVSVSTGISSTWTYTTNAWRLVQGTGNITHFFVSGLAEEGIDASYQCRINAVANNQFMAIGLGLSSTTLVSAAYSCMLTAGNQDNPHASATFAPQVGVKYVAALELAESASGTNQFLGHGAFAMLTMSTMM